MIKHWFFVVLLLTACGGDSLIPQAEAQGGLVPIAPRNTTIQTEFTQYRDAARPLQGDGGDCKFAGTALSASTNLLYVGGWRQVILVHWNLAITPNGGAARLVAFDSGVGNVEELARWGSDSNSPISAGGFVTEHFVRFVDQHIQQKQIGVQVCGHAQVWSSVIEVVQRVDN